MGLINHSVAKLFLLMCVYVENGVFERSGVKREIKGRLRCERTETMDMKMYD